MILVGITTCVIQELATKRLIGLAKWNKGLFVLDFDPSSLENYSIPPIVMFTFSSESVPYVSFDDKEVSKCYGIIDYGIFLFLVYKK